jgi:hypothetical protein
MLRQPFEAPYIFPDEFWGSVVIVENSECPINDSMISLSDPDVDGK